MKRVLILVLALVMSLSLCACGGGDSTTDTGETNKATVITNEGDTVEMSAEELIAVYDSNEAKFDKLYSKAQITFTGTVSNIRIGTNVFVRNSLLTGQNKVLFEEGWCLTIGSENTTIDLADLDVGAVYEVTTCIVGAYSAADFSKDIGDDNKVLWLVGDDLMYGERFASVETTMKAIE